MIRALILKKLASAEAELGESLDYVRHILRTSLRSFFKFTKIFPLSEYRRELPKEPYHVARIVATRDEDCGTCLQIEVNLARKDGVPDEVVRAVVEERFEDLPTELADVARFVDAVVCSSGEEEVLRERVRGRYGEAELVELALAIAACRFFPITKRTLRYATSCALVMIR